MANEQNLPEPITREEKYLAKAAGAYDGELPDPETRVEKYLNAIAEGGGGGFTPTETQLAAINSGITATDVEQITTNKNNILSLETNISSVNILSAVTVAEGYTLNADYSYLYRQGTRIYGNLIISKNSDTFGSAQVAIGNISAYPPEKRVITGCRFGTSVYEVTNNGYLYINYAAATGGARGAILVKDYVANTDNTVNITIDYCISSQSNQ